MSPGGGVSRRWCVESNKAAVARFEAAMAGRTALAGGVDARLPNHRVVVGSRAGGANDRLRGKTVSGDFTTFKAAERYGTPPG